MELEYLSEYEAYVRLASFLFLFCLFAIWEVLAPRRMSLYSKALRWINNISITLLNTIIIRTIVPFAAISTAAVVQQQNLGLLNLFQWPMWTKILIAVLAMDLALYFQHMIFHHVHFLWRLHRMHHADLEVDVTTGTRFHPIEIILSLIIKVAVVLVIGVPVMAVLIFEVLLNATSLFNHANIYLPLKADRVIRFFLVTPDMHRVHHSISSNETNSNFGFNLPWWDYLFKTYRAQPHAGHQNMKIGIEHFRNKRELWLDRLLLQPFRATLKSNNYEDKKITK